MGKSSKCAKCKRELCRCNYPKTESKPLREWMQSVKWPDNAPDWSHLGKIDCTSLEEALSMIASTSSMPITARRYYKGTLDAMNGLSYTKKSFINLYESAKQGYYAGLTILEAQKANSPKQSETVQVAYISVAPDDYERMSRRDAHWSEMVAKLRQLSGQVSDLLNQMEKL